LLIAPLVHLFEVNSIVIVPFGPLHSLPFHALFDGENYLLDRFVISYAPSATIYALQEIPSFAAKSPGDSSLILGVDDRNTPFIRKEVNAVAAVVPHPQLFVGADATEQVLRENGPRSRLIHIASHGYFRQDSPMFSAIRLADSYLSLYDLYYMDLPADLLTLSGCVTGLGVVAEGDELLGLSRGLLFAGVRSLVLTLWDVDDESAADFMSSFYSRLSRNSSKAPALRDAMLDLRQRFLHPFYWAPFKLIAKAGSN
jgi:CHAT domain-containing protein